MSEYELYKSYQLAEEEIADMKAENQRLKERITELEEEVGILRAELKAMHENRRLRGAAIENM
jgi:cell division protein FtsB